MAGRCVSDHRRPGRGATARLTSQVNLAESAARRLNDGAHSDRQLEIARVDLSALQALASSLARPSARRVCARQLFTGGACARLRATRAHRCATLRRVAQLALDWKNSGTLPVPRRALV